MLPFEEQILNYIRDTGNHVLYRVTPMYNEEELVCRGMRLEAQSVEDHGKTLCFHVYCYNLQPHVQIDYTTGRNQASGPCAVANGSFVCANLGENTAQSGG